MADANGTNTELVVGNVSNAGSLTPTSWNVSGISFLYGWNNASATWQQVQTDGSGNLKVSVTGTAVVTPPKSQTGSATIVASTTSDITILASNTNRLGGMVFNNSTAILSLLLANATSNATTFSFQMPATSYFEIPFNYVGVIKGFWSSAAGTALVTEFT